MEISIMLKFFLCFFLILNNSCLRDFYFDSFEDNLSRITRETGEEIERKFSKLKLVGIGGSMEDEVIIHEKLVFNHKGDLSKEEWFYLINYSVDKYIENFMLNKKMREYLESFSFSYKNIRIVFIVYDDDGNEVFHPDLGYVSLYDGFVSFDTVNVDDNGFYNIKTIEKLSYEETAKKLGLWKEF